MNRYVEAYESLVKVIDELSSLPSTSIILVEGRKDESALRALGIRSKIAAVNSSKPLEEIVSGYQEAILLLDYDRRGMLLSKRLEVRLRAASVRPNLEYRRRIRRFTMGELSHIEGLKAYVRSMEARAGKGHPTSRTRVGH